MSVGNIRLDSSVALVADVRRPRALLAAGCILLALFVLLGVAVAAAVEAPFSQHIDDWWRGIIGASPDSVFHTTPIPMLFQYLGELPGAVLMFLAIPLGLTLFGRWRSALFFASSWAASMVVVTQLIKRVVDRPRPALDEACGCCRHPPHLRRRVDPPPPARVRLRAVWWVVGGLVVVGMILQRTLINAHWLSDTFAGVTAGAATALLMWWAFWTLLRADYGRRVPFLRRTAHEPADPAGATSLQTR